MIKEKDANKIERDSCISKRTKCVYIQCTCVYTCIHHILCMYRVSIFQMEWRFASSRLAHLCTERIEWSGWKGTLYSSPFPPPLSTLSLLFSFLPLSLPSLPLSPPLSPFKKRKAFFCGPHRLPSTTTRYLATSPNP